MLALAALVGWSLVYSAVLTRGAPRWVTLGDAAVLSCLALASALVVAPSWLDAGRSWLVPFLTFAGVAHQDHTPPRPGVPASLAVAVATGVGTASSSERSSSCDSDARSACVRAASSGRL